MALTINTNVASLNAQRNLGKSQNDLNKSMQRLSSGLRINSAKDDAAGLAISDRMTSQIRGLNQAARNANDGISLAQTAEGALQETTNILQRMRELAVQSANDTNSASDRKSLQAEVSQLQAEIGRIAETTEFNGKSLLDGTMKDATFQVGANAGTQQTISFGIDSAKTADLSVVGTTIKAGTTVAGKDVSAAGPAAGSIVVNGTEIDDPASSSNVDIAAAINAAATTANDGVATTIATAVNVQTLDFSRVTLETAGGVTATQTTPGLEAVAAEQSVALTGLVMANTEELVFTFASGGTFTYTAGGAENADDVGAALAAAGAGGTITETGGTGAQYKFSYDAATDTLSVAQVAGQEAPIANFSVDDSGAATGLNSTLVTPVETGVTAQAAVQALDLSSTTVAAGETLDFEIDGTTVTFTNGATELSGADLAAAIAADFGATKDVDGETYSFAQAGTTATLNISQAAGSEAPIALITAGAEAAGTYTIALDGGTAVDVTATAGTVVTAAEMASVINGIDGFTAKLNDAGKVEITKTDGTSFSIVEDIQLDGATPAAASAGLAGISEAATTFKGQISLNSTEEIVLTGEGLADAGLGTVGNATTTINLVDISTREGASIAIASVDAALAQVGTIRGDLGAVQNRFESTIANLSNVSENLSAARSRILDADIAMETSAMTKNNILQQAGVSILAQANQAPQLALSLLG